MVFMSCETDNIDKCKDLNKQVDFIKIVTKPTECGSVRSFTTLFKLIGCSLAP